MRDFILLRTLSAPSGVVQEAYLNSQKGGYMCGYTVSDAADELEMMQKLTAVV